MARDSPPLSTIAMYCRNALRRKNSTKVAHGRLWSCWLELPCYYQARLSRNGRTCPETPYCFRPSPTHITGPVLNVQLGVVAGTGHRHQRPPCVGAVSYQDTIPRASLDSLMKMRATAERKLSAPIRFGGELDFANPACAPPSIQYRYRCNQVGCQHDDSLMTGTGKSVDAERSGRSVKGIGTLRHPVTRPSLGRRASIRRSDAQSRRRCHL